MTKTTGALLLLAALASARAYAADAYERIDASVAMSDGVRLDASLYLPQAPARARLPLIVRQHGGGSNKDSPFDVQYGLKAVATGRFALLMYSARGHGNSEGLFDFFGPRTTQDFSEMLDWVAAIHGARVDTANVGSAGYSQGGGESLLPAARDPRVKALAVGNTFADLNYALNPNDCFKFSFATGIFLGAYTSTLSRADDTLALRWGAAFYSDTEDAGTPLLPSTTDDLAARSPQTYVDALAARRVPVFWTNAWEDQLFPADHPERMLATLEARGVPVHYWFASGGHAAGASYPAEEERREQAMLEWFDQYLYGIDHDYGRRPRVDYWQRASGDPRKPGEWRHYTAAAWPILDAAAVSLYPQADGSLGARPAAAGATATLVNGYASLNVANDALVREIAGNVPGMGDVLDRVPEGAGPLDTLSYASAPLAQPLNVVGAPVVTVTQDSTHAVVQQLDAKVWDVGDDGARLIWRGGISGMNGSEVAFKLWPNAHRFEIGHRVVLTVSSVDFPTFKPDVEPWQSTISLGGTRLDLPAVPQPVPAARSLPSGGAMPFLLLFPPFRRRLWPGAARSHRPEGLTAR
ncbi:MAG: CocE/NonD family hydrolase [Gammaproteobacteria bacterium]|nr:CocE/NonD family hydrolase [Gammaproteobacteria bacterium]